MDITEVVVEQIRDVAARGEIEEISEKLDNALQSIGVLAAIIHESKLITISKLENRLPYMYCPIITERLKEENNQNG